MPAGSEGRMRLEAGVEQSRNVELVGTGERPDREVHGGLAVEAALAGGLLAA